jgi:hypothetical protein
VHPRDGHLTGLHGLAERLEHVPAEFGELVEEENSMMSHGHFTGSGDGAAAHQRLRRRRVVGGPDGPLVHQCHPVGQQAHGRINPRRLQRLHPRERREDRRNPLGQHRLARAGRADHQQIVRPRAGDCDRPLHQFLPPHVGEIQVSVEQRRLVGLPVQLVRLQRQHLVEK